MKRLIRMAALGAAVFLSLGLTACNTKGPASSAGSSSPSAPNVDLGQREIVLAGLNIGAYFQEPGNSAFGDQLLARYKELEEMYNCKITFKQESKARFLSNYQTSFAAKQPYADIVYAQVYYARGWARSGMITPWDDLSTIDITADKYNESYTNMMQYGEKHYGLDFTTWSGRLFGNFQCHLLANLSLIERCGQKSPYALIEEGNWTWDSLRDIAVACTDKEAGTWGFANHVYRSALWANGLREIVLDSRNERWTFGYMADSTSFAHAYDWAMKLTQEDQCVAYEHNSLNNPGSETYFLSDIFGAGKAVFVNLDMEWLTYGDENGGWILDMEDRYGMVPFPLGPDNPDGSYTSRMTGNCWTWFMPAYVENPADVARIFDKLSDPLDGKTAEEAGAYTKETFFQNNEDSYYWYTYLLANGEGDHHYDMGILPAAALWTTLQDGIENQAFTASQVLEREGPPYNQYLNESMNNDPKLKGE